jgi:predicted regulator of Ras-like GTPase activity (Roadblock/LC7/MglB family)
LTNIEDMVHALHSVTKAEAVALINRDGGIVAAELPPNVSQETFSIMCAAILGAGMTAATELKHAAPHRVVLEAEDSAMLIQEIGRRHMLVLVALSERHLASAASAIGRFTGAVEAELG